MMRLDIYINYRGTCEEAFRFYAEHLGGVRSDLIRHSTQPGPNVPAEWGDKVLHARMELGGTTLMGADIPTAEPMRSAYLTLTFDREEEAERVYALLAEGRRDLHEAGEDRLCQPLRDAARPVRHVVDAAAARGGLTCS